MISRGAPKEHPLLSVSWIRSAEEPHVNLAPHYVSTGKASPSPPLHLFRGTEGRWQIAPEVGAGLAYAVANGPGAHPNTVRAGEWLVPHSADGSNWQPAKDFVLKLDSLGTEKEPLLLEELGDDFFMRVRATKLVWFVDPNTGAVCHSGAKAAGAQNKPGVRYCPVCAATFSANNFQSQHVPNVHKPSAPMAPTCIPDGAGGVQLTWRTPEGTSLTAPVSFSVELSRAGGPWETFQEDTLNPEAVASVPASALAGGSSYKFRVATHTLGIRGPFSPPSVPFAPSDHPSINALSTGPSKRGGGSLAITRPMDTTATTDDQFTQPLSPLHAGVGAQAASRDGGGSGMKRPRSARLEDTSPDDLIGLAGPEDSLTWTLEEMWEIMTSSSAEAGRSTTVSPSPEVDTKRARRGGPTSDAPPPLLEHTTVPADGPDREMYARQLSATVKQEGGESLLLDALLQRFNDTPPQPQYRDANDVAQLLAASQPPPSATHAAAAPRAVTTKAVPSEAARLARLRLALSSVPPASRARQVTLEVLRRFSQAGWLRELSLLLTFSSPATADAAAAADPTCRRLLADLRRAAPASSAPADPPPLTARAVPQGRGWLGLLLVVVAALLLVTWLLGWGLAAAKPPVPMCRWEGLRGCRPANEFTTSCRTRLLANTRCDAS